MKLAWAVKDQPQPIVEKAANLCLDRRCFVLPDMRIETKLNMQFGTGICFPQGEARTSGLVQPARSRSGKYVVFMPHIHLREVRESREAVRRSYQLRAAVAGQALVLASQWPEP